MFCLLYTRFDTSIGSCKDTFDVLPMIFKGSVAVNDFESSALLKCFKIVIKVPNFKRISGPALLEHFDGGNGHQFMIIAKKEFQNFKETSRVFCTGSHCGRFPTESTLGLVAHWESHWASGRVPSCRRLGRRLCASSQRRLHSAPQRSGL